ncbi:tetratricopeptide repeat-containing protein, partial [Bacteroides salyersiae]
NKRLWEITSDKSYLNSAIDSYKKGWNQYKDYYTGENYATCMYIKSLHEISEELKTHSIVEAKLTYAEIIDIILKSLEDPEAEELLWKYASLSNAYLALGNHAEAEKYERLFHDQQPLQWQIDSFEKTKSILKK